MNFRLPDPLSIPPAAAPRPAGLAELPRPRDALHTPRPRDVLHTPRPSGAVHTPRPGGIAAGPGPGSATGGQQPREAMGAPRPHGVIEERPRPCDAIETPHNIARSDLAQARADIEACALTDALIDAEDAHAELQSRFTDLRAMKPATAALLFGSEAAWRQALARVGVATGRQLSAVEALRRRLRATPAFSLDEIARPLGPATRVQWTGD